MASYPLVDFTLTFTGDNNTMSFKVFEARRSRDLRGVSELVYNVIADPYNDTQMTAYCWSDAAHKSLNYVSDEVLIAWNVFNKAGITFFNESTIRKWPPLCKQIGTNQYEVTIRYAPLFLVDFTINPLGTTRKESIATPGTWQFTDGDFVQRHLVNMSTIERIANSYINVKAEGGKTTIQGVKVQDPVLNWTERWSWGPYAELFKGVGGTRTSYINILNEMSCTVNYAPFRGFKKGEVLFRSASGRNTGPLLWEIDYNFSARPNRNFLTIGGRVISLRETEARYGWNHTDIEEALPMEVTVGVSEKRYKMYIPPFVRIHQVYPWGDFSVLETQPQIELGTSQQLKNLAQVPSIGGVVAPPVEAT